MGLLLVLVVILIVFGGLPQWGWHTYGYTPVSIGAVILILIVALVLMGRI